MRRPRGSIAGSVIVGVIVLAVAVFGRRPPPTPERPEPTPRVTDAAPARDVPGRATSRSSTPQHIEPAAAIRWRVVSVHDGDTVWCLDDDKVRHKVRLHGIDAPELGQPFGTKSRDRLAELTKGRTVEVEEHGRDRYGRPLARLEVEGQDVNRQIVADGLAWHYTRYSDDAALSAAEADARAARRGLWADAHPVPPWEWRASEKERKAAAKRAAAQR